MSKIFKRGKKGTYYTRVYTNGKEYWRSLGTTDRKEAKERAARISAAVEQRANDSKPSAGLKLTDMAGLDVERAVAEGSDPEITISRLGYMWRSIIAVMGDLPVGKVNDRQVMSYIMARRSASIRGQTIRRELQTLRRGLLIAKKYGEHVQDIDWPKIKSDPPLSKQRGKLWPPATIMQVLEKLPVDAKDELLLCLYTGLRATELRRLRYDWIEPAPQGSPTPAVLRLPAEATKTRQPRIIGLTVEAMEIIRRRLAASGGKEPLVFDGTDYHKALALASKACGLSENLTKRDLRHTFATLALQGSGDAIAVQAALGHSNLSMTNRYQHSTVLRTASASAAVAALLSNSDNENGGIPPL